MTERMIGTVTRVFHRNGYAFLKGSDGYTRFFNAADMMAIGDWDLIAEDLSLSFVPAGKFNNTEGAKNNGLKALSVRVLRD